MNTDWDITTDEQRKDFTLVNSETLRTQPTFQRRINVFNIGDQRWGNVDPTLKFKQNPTSVPDVGKTSKQRYATYKQRCTTLVQRWYNIVST